LLGALALLPSGCGLLRAPQQMVSAVVPTSSSKQPDPLQVQLQVQRFVEDFAMGTAQALDEYARRVDTEPARVQALKLKLAAVSAVTDIASGPNPNANLLDVVSVVTLNRMAIEDYWMKTANGPAFQPWLEISRVQETNVWELAAGALKPAQLDELHKAINQWRARNPLAISGFFARPRELGPMFKTAEEKSADLNSVFGLVGLDPTAGLDPAVREVTRTRLFAERAMATLQLMPYLLRWQMELLSYQLADQSAVKQALANVDQFSKSTAVFAKTAEQLPKLVNDQREAAIQQLFAGVATERSNLVASMATGEKQLRELLPQVRQTVEAADGMATSLDAAIKSLDAFVRYVSPPNTNTAPKPVNTNSRPFNILDYGTAAGQIGVMAKDINTLLTSVNESTPQIARLGQQAGADVDRAVSRAFRLGLVLIGVLLAGAVLAGLAYRVLARRLAPPAHEASAPKAAPGP
jgi:hypothetical protein